VKAISYNLLAWAILPFMDAIAKYLSSELSFFQITWARYFFTVFWTLPFMFIFFRKKINTCYINFSYSSIWRSLSFVVFSYFDLKKITIIFKKWIIK